MITYCCRILLDFGLSHDLNTEDYDDTFLIVNWESESDDEDDSEMDVARSRILKNYDLELEQLEPKEVVLSKEELHAEKLSEWKSTYYKEKLEFKTEENVSQLVFDYFEGMQWVLHYYYHGVQSWSWFFPHHYAPIISGY